MVLLRSEMYRFNCSACHFGWATIIKINQVIQNMCAWLISRRRRLCRCCCCCRCHRSYRWFVSLGSPQIVVCVRIYFFIHPHACKHSLSNARAHAQTKNKHTHTNPIQWYSSSMADISTGFVLTLCFLLHNATILRKNERTQPLL